MLEIETALCMGVNAHFSSRRGDEGIKLQHMQARAFFLFFFFWGGVELGSTWLAPLATVNKWKLEWFRSVKHHDCLTKTILQGTLEGGRQHGRQRKCWMSGHPCPYQNCPQGPPTEKTGREPLLNCPSCPP